MDTDTVSPYLNPNYYYGLLMADFGSVQDSAGREYPITGTTPVEVNPTTGQAVTSVLAGNATVSQPKPTLSPTHHVAMWLAIGLVFSILILGFVAVKLSFTVR